MRKGKKKNGSHADLMMESGFILGNGVEYGKHGNKLLYGVRLGHISVFGSNL